MFWIFIIAIILSCLFSIVVRRLAWRFGVVDNPGTLRKIHKKPIALLGGLALYLSFFFVVFVYDLFFGGFNGTISSHQLIGLFLASTVLMVGGVLDDRYNIAPLSFLFPFFATLVILWFNIGITQITNPFGGVFNLDFYNWQIGEFFGQTYVFVLIADVFTVVWLLGMSYTTKFLDGIDGLVSGITAIGAIVIFLLSMSERFYQYDVALLALIFCGVCIGFLIFNRNPASIFLGEGGSVFTGFMLGVLAIISGGKIATALLVMGIPILDVFWVISRRLYKRKSIFVHDDSHIHHRLLAYGLSQKQIVLLLSAISFSFGLTTLFLQSIEKILALVALFLVMIVIGIIVIYKKDKSVYDK